MDLRSLIAKMDAIESKISEEVAAPAANPYTDPVQAAIYAAMSPADQAWATKGGGRPDLTDKYIANRAPNKFKPVATAANPTDARLAAGTQTSPGAEPAAPAAAPLSRGVNAQGQNVTITNPDGSTTNPESGVTTAAVPEPKVDQVTTGQAANPAAPVNRDAMPFGKAFADAKAKGEKVFAWKGKKYAVQTAAPKQAANPAPAAAPNTQGYNPTTTNPQGMDFSQVSAESIERGTLANALIESFGYTK